MTDRIKVFLSYSSTDAELARRLALDLRSVNIDVWLDQWQLGVGEEIAQKIDKGVEQADFVIVLLTRASVASKWVQHEWRQKVLNEAQTQRVAVIPVRGEVCEIPDFLAQRSSADISGGSYPQGFRYLLEILRHHSDDGGFDMPKRGAVSVGDESLPSMIPVVTPITLEVGTDLIPLFESNSQGGTSALDRLAPLMRNALHQEFGFSFPGVRVRGVADMPAAGALIMIDEIPEAMFEVSRQEVLVNANVEVLKQYGIQANAREDLVTGQARARIDPGDRAAADDAGFTTWDAAEYLFYALHTVVRSMADCFLDIDTTYTLVAAIERSSPQLVAETVPKTWAWIDVCNTLQLLLEEEISIADMESILLVLSQYKQDEQHDTVLMAERIRHALNKQITAKLLHGRDSLPVVRLDAGIENHISDSIHTTPSGSYLDADPEVLQKILAAIRRQIGVLDAAILTQQSIRRYIRKLVELEFPWLKVISPQDLEPDTRIEEVAWIRLESTPEDQTGLVKEPAT